VAAGRAAMTYYQTICESCIAGYWCSNSTRQHACDTPTFYCAASASQPTLTKAGFYSVTTANAAAVASPQLSGLNGSPSRRTLGNEKARGASSGSGSGSGALPFGDNSVFVWFRVDGCNTMDMLSTLLLYMIVASYHQ
jgi:hypothetical protein